MLILCHVKHLRFLFLSYDLLPDKLVFVYIDRFVLFLQANITFILVTWIYPCWERERKRMRKIITGTLLIASACVRNMLILCVNNTEIFISVCLLVCLSIHLPSNPSICFSLVKIVWLSLSICLLVCVFLSVCLSGLYLETR